MRILSFLSALHHARNVLQKAILSAGYEGSAIVGEPSDSRFGDISSSVPFYLATIRGEDPSEIAQSIVKNITISMGAPFESVRSEGGYINFSLDKPRFSEEVLKEILEKGADYGKPPLASKKRILIEHTNSNPNKALHIGIIRNTVLGDCLNRILSFIGHEVIVLNYIDDSGAQVADNIVAHLYLGYPMESCGERFDEYAGKIYSEVHEKIEQNAELLLKKSDVIRKIEEGGNEISEMARRFSERVVADQLRTCWRVGAFFDLLNWESDIIRSGLFQEAMDELKRIGRAYIATDERNRGALMLRLSDVDEFKQLEQADEVMLRSDGTATYPGKDIAYAWWKVGRPKADFKYREFTKQPNGRTLWTTDSLRGRCIGKKYNGADLAITLVDVRQEYPQKVVKNALRFLSEESAKSYRPYLYGLVALSGPTATSLTNDRSFLKRRVVHMSGRKGLVMNADRILDELSKRARDESKKRNPSAGEEWLDTVASDISIGSLRYALVKVDIDNVIVFDMEEILNLEGDTGSRLQYTHARAHGILEKAKQPTGIETRAELLSSEPEWDLIKELSKFSYVVERATEDLQPKYVAHYARRLADKFNVFYESCPVLSAETDELKSSRLSLVRAFTLLFGKVLDLLGIPPLKEM